MERCGKINASNSGSESWTGIGVVAGFCTVVLIMQWPHRRNGEVTWKSELLQRLQEVRGNCKTRNQLTLQRHLFISLLISIRCAICTSSVLTAFASPTLLISMSCKALYFKYLHTMKEKSNTCANITSQYWLKMR